MIDLIEFIKSNAKNYPDRIAIIDGERRISYADFLNLVNCISNNIISDNLKPKVIVDLKQGFEAYALIVAIINIDGTYCPLNPDAPIERKMQVISEFAPDYVIVETEEKALEFNSLKATTIEQLLKDKNFSDVRIDYNPNSISYVIYTSGTTGSPKGVMIYRKALNKFLEWSMPAYAAGENDIWGQFSLLSFDLSIVDIFTCLCSGATLLAMNDAIARKFRPLSVIEKYKITIWHSVPSAVEFMIVNEKSKTYDFSSLRLLSFCGEPLRTNQVKFLFDKKSDLIIFNTYGPTEGTLFCTWQELTSTSYIAYGDFTICIGKAIPGWNLQLRTLEAFTEKEIIIYGDYIGKGYLGNVANTKFNKIEINNEMISAFETGDLITEKDGNLYFAGRKDRQVKIKGFRIELDEIDFRINEFLKKLSVTLVNNDALYSFIETNEEIDEKGLREYLQTKIEPYKIPNSFYTIMEIPRNQNQKVDNNKLIQLLS